MLTKERIAELREIVMSAPDCGDGSCRFTTARGGMRTNGGCRCLNSRSTASASSVEKYAIRANPRTLSELLDAVETLTEALERIKEISFYGINEPGGVAHHALALVYGKEGE